MNTAAVDLQGSVASQTDYQDHVNPQWVRLLRLLDMNVRYVDARGRTVDTEDGTHYLDFLSGYCVHNTGHNHPHIVAALHEELSRNGPSMLQSHVAETAGELGSNVPPRRWQAPEGLFLQFRQRRRGDGHQIRSRLHRP